MRRAAIWDRRERCEASGRNPRSLQRPRERPFFDPQLVPHVCAQPVVVAQLLSTGRARLASMRESSNGVSASVR
jgi:hypothetical protein